MNASKLVIVSIAVLITIVAVEFIFMQFKLFSYVPHIGIVLHILGGCFSGLLLYGICIDSMIKIPFQIQMIFVLGTAAIAAIGWEAFEWTLSWLLNKRMQGTINNIMLDLATGMAGGMLACVWLYANKSTTKS
jgi:hypothetical protein